jgi:hypothetical protein
MASISAFGVAACSIARVTALNSAASSVPSAGMARWPAGVSSVANDASSAVTNGESTASDTPGSSPPSARRPSIRRSRPRSKAGWSTSAPTGGWPPSAKAVKSIGFLKTSAPR